MANNIGISVFDNAQFQAFTRFAASVADKGTALKAEVDLKREDGTPRQIVAKGYDGWGKICRDQNSKNINDDIRSLFKATVLGMFGVDDFEALPETVRKAMKTDDYGTVDRPSGKPLTARRIIAVSKAIAKVVDGVNSRVPLRTAAGLVDDSVKYINGIGKNHRAGEAKLTVAQHDQAARLISKYGKGMAGSALRIFSNYVVLGIACGSYNDEQVDWIASRMSDELKSVRNFKLGDVRFAKLDAKLTAYWQSLFEDYMENAGKFDEDGFFTQFVKDVNRSTFTIGGDTFSMHDSEQMIDKLKNTVPNVNHRKALSMFMCQTSGTIYQTLSSMQQLLPTSKFATYDVTSAKGHEMLFAVDGFGDNFFDNSPIGNGASAYKLEISDDGTKAKITARFSGNILFRIAGSDICSENATGVYTYENEFEFDLSDANEAKLTGTHLSQVLEVPEEQKQPEPQEDKEKTTWH